MAHPTRFERVTFAFGGQKLTLPMAAHRIRPVARIGCCKPRNYATGCLPTPRHVALRKRAMVLHVVDRRQVAWQRCSIELLTPSRSDATVCGGGARKGYPRECGAPAPAGHSAAAPATVGG